MAINPPNDGEAPSSDIVDRTFQYARRAVRLVRAVLAKRDGASALIVRHLNLEF